MDRGSGERERRRWRVDRAPPRRDERWSSPPLTPTSVSKDGGRRPPNRFPSVDARYLTLLLSRPEGGREEKGEGKKEEGREGDREKERKREVGKGGGMRKGGRK